MRITSCEQSIAAFRICVNGHAISQRTLLRNGYRLLIGNNHFFRVNCPKEAIDMNASIMEESTAMLFDYDDAWHEVIVFFFFKFLKRL